MVHLVVRLTLADTTVTCAWSRGVNPSCICRYCARTFMVPLDMMDTTPQMMATRVYQLLEATTRQPVESAVAGDGGRGAEGGGGGAAGGWLKCGSGLRHRGAHSGTTRKRYTPDRLIVVRHTYTVCEGGRGTRPGWQV